MALKYRKFDPGEYVMKVKNGTTLKEGLGLSFFYNTMNTAILVIPSTAIDIGFAFDDIMTSDYQSCYVQGMITYRFLDYRQASTMLDFAFAENKAEYAEKRRTVFQAVNTRLINLAKIILIRTISVLDIRTALKSGDDLVEKLQTELCSSEILKEFGIEILNLTILGVAAKPETRKALEAAAREQILKEQDEAIYMRRNAAIEQERIVKENELNTEIKVAEKAREKKEKELETRRVILERELALEKKRADERIRLEKDQMEAKILLEERNKELVSSEMENERRRSEEKAYAMTMLMKAFETVDVGVLEALAISGMDPKALVAKAFLEIGDKAERIGNLNVTPDLLETLTGK
ncbi:MAG: hypothetical protein IJA58_04110 [Lachnospiraceae bacterium]|nr:hypothetical protein [Lachnospiraceae bacterium]